jgi:hypothetical protein
VLERSVLHFRPRGVKCQRSLRESLDTLKTFACTGRRGHPL